MILSILEKYGSPLFQVPDSGSAASPGGVGSTPSESGGVGQSGVPASAPAGSSAPPGEPGPGDESFLLTDEVMEVGDLDGFVEPSPPSGGPQAPEGQPTQAQAQQPTPQLPKEAVAQQPQQAQPTAPEGRAGTTGQPSAPQPLSPSQQLAQLMQNRDALVGELASKRFQLSQKDQEAMETNALEHIPKLLARTYFDAFTSTMNYMNQQVPQMIQSALNEAKLDQDAETSFYSAWPGLDRGRHGADVLAYANAFRQMNPRASLEEAVKFVGAAVATKHGVANANVRPTVSGQNTQRGNGARKGAPFAPGMGSRAAPQGQQQVEQSPFEGLGFVFD